MFSPFAMTPTPPTLTASVRHENPLDLPATLRPLQVGRYDPCMRIFAADRPHHGGRAVMAFRTPLGPVTVLVEQELDPDSEPRLLPGLRPCGRVHASAWGPGSEWALTRLEDLVGLSDDPSDFQPEHPLVRRIHRHRIGVRLAKTHRVADLLAPCILHQLVTGRDAMQAWTRVVHRCAEPAPGPFELSLPPSMPALVALSLGKYVESGVLAKQAAAVKAMARVADRLDETAEMDAPDAYRRLVSVRGIGPWTAASVMLAGMGFADAVAVGDFHLPNHVGWALAREERGDDARMLELLEPFRPHRGRVVRLLMSAGFKAPKRGPRHPARDPRVW